MCGRFLGFTRVSWGFYGGGVGFWGSKSLIIDLESILPWYMVRSGVWSDLLKSDRKVKIFYLYAILRGGVVRSEVFGTF